MPVIKDDYRHLDPAGIAMAMEQKAHLESYDQSARILEGTLSITERGPKELRPQVPEELRGALLWGMTNMNRPAKTKAEQIADFKRLQSIGYIAKDAPCRVYENGECTVIESTEL